MCGIFGLAIKQGIAINRNDLQQLLKNLYILSESRGKESAGLYIYLPKSGNAWTLKGNLAASELLKSSDYDKTLNTALNHVYSNDKQNVNLLAEPIIILAHSRLVTNGSAMMSQNNQPVSWHDVTMIHNGIVVNADQLWAAHPHLKRYAEVDTEVMAAMLCDEMQKKFDPATATRTMFSKIKGAASVAWIHEKSDTLTLATNTGDLYYLSLPDSVGIVFASEHFILEQAVKDISKSIANFDKKVEWLNSGNALSINLSAAETVCKYSLSEQTKENISINEPVSRAAIKHQCDIKTSTLSPEILVKNADLSLLKYKETTIRSLKRCSRCILPETFPFINFDNNGVCNYCHHYKPRYAGMHRTETKANFIQSLEKYRRSGSQPDVLIPFSGGRDSSYGLHLISKEFGLKPITFTYDWGMVTDLARRNIARMCGQLGVQNILVSADLKLKRENIRKNVSAWLKKPDLGMVPLFMAGDKHFFKIVNQLKKQTGISLDLWCANPLENTDFKSGFCGVEPDFEKHRLDYLSLSRKLRMIFYYATRFITNPGYINTSLLDTFGAFQSYYFEPRTDFYFIFDHFIWDENDVNQVLLNQYDWELSSDSSSTWRIGDGTAPFYNYIYMTACGFSEFDTFRSNQIREGMMTRQQALESIVNENKPRAESMRWYLDTINLDFNQVIKTINKLDKLGLHQ